MVKKKKISAPKTYPEIGERLRRFREQHLGMNSKEFYTENNFSQTQLSNWESGHRRITIEAATLLRQRYDLPLDYIFMGIESALPQNILKALASKPIDKS